MRSKQVKILFATVAAFVALCTQAATETVNGIEWEYTVTEEGTAVIESGGWYVPAIDQSTSGAVVVPSVLGGYPVTSIGRYAFWCCRGLTSVTIPNSVTNIRSSAFSGCGLTSVTIPNSVTSIGYSAFEGCSGLADVQGFVIVRGVLYDYFGEDGNIVIPDSVTSIDHGAFQGCSVVTSVTIPGSVTNIGSQAFYECSSLTSITISGSATSIGNWAFYGCSSLTSVTIPNSVTNIGDCAFYDCDGLADERGFVIIHGVLYYYCGENEVVIIPDDVTSIGDYAFEDCSGLTSITIPNSVTNIGYSAFDGCKPTSVTVPGHDCGIDFSSVTNLVISDGVESIDEGAFEGCRGLTSVTIPNSITNIGDFAFWGCKSLESVTIPANVASIGDYAFEYSGLETVNFEGDRDQIEMDVYSAFAETPWLLSSPTNDNFADAITLSGKAGSVEGKNINATSEAIDDSLGFGLATVWWKWTASSSATMQFDTFGSEFDTMLGIYVLDDGTLTEVAFNDEDEYGEIEYGESRVKFNANAGTTYYIGISGYSDDQGFITLSWQQLISPENDNFADAITLSGKAGSVEGSNINAISEAIDDSLGFGFATVWWKWTASSSANVQFDTFGSEFNTILGIYVLDDGTLTEVAFNDENEYDENGYGGNRVKFNANAGTTYYIGISGYSYRQGDILLNWDISFDAFPLLGESATMAEVAAALEGSMDVKLVENINTAAEYAAFREWALNFDGVTPGEVKGSPNAWLSYALNTATLIAAAPKEGDIVIDTFESAATEGAFEFTVKIDGITVGENALEANIKKVFDIEGAEKLVSDGAGFSSDNVEVNAAAPENGNVRFTVTPKGGALGTTRPASFFFRVKMK